MEREEYQKREDELLKCIRKGVRLLNNIPGGPYFQDLEVDLIRVATNSAMVQIGVLTHLLIEKGIITWDEYFELALKMLETEVKRYEVMCRKSGMEVTLL